MNLSNNISFTLLSYMWLFNGASKYDLINFYNGHSQREQILDTINGVLPRFNNIINTSNNNNNNNNTNSESENTNNENNNSSNNNNSNNTRNNNNQIITMDDLFFTLSIHRTNLIEDTLNGISNLPQKKLRSPLKVSFIDEQAIDQGGVKKEFFMLLLRQIFDPSYGMFTYSEHSRLFWFNIFSFEPLKKFELIGIIFGLAIYNSIILDVKFPSVIYKKLIGVKPELKDLKQIDEELYKSMKFLIETDDQNLEENLDMNFTTTVNKFGEQVTINLIEGGDKIMINYKNKEEYVKIFLDWYFNKSIDSFYKSFEKGFFHVFDEGLSRMLSPEELEMIICGKEILDLNELKKFCKYEDGYDENSLSIKYFWEILNELSKDEKKKFLAFVTGCDRVPINGLGGVKIVIIRTGDDGKHLPSAHTCFNSLVLPDYQDKGVMEKNLKIAINYSEGFGFA